MRLASLTAGPVAYALLFTTTLLAAVAHAQPVPWTSSRAQRNAHDRFTLSVNPPVATSRPTLASTVVEGEWREFGLLQVRDPLSVHDATLDELLSIGGSRSTNWVLDLGGSPRWRSLPVTSSEVITDARTAAVDPSTGSIYVSGFGDSGLVVRVLDPRTGTVTPLEASGSPPVVTAHALCFDPVHQRLIVFGGLDSLFEGTNRVWVMDLLPTPAWSEWSPSGLLPPGLYLPYVVLDPIRRFLLIPDARQPGPSYVWALTLDGAPQWLRFASNGLPRGANPNPFVYDTVSDRFWTVDAQGAVLSLSPLTWRWTEEAPIGAGPSPREGVGLAVDGTRHRLLVSGGGTRWGDDIYADTWVFSLDAPRQWTQVTPDPPRPPMRFGASDGLDLSRGRLLVFGGSDEFAPFFRNDTWALELDAVPTWSRLETAGEPPAPRYWHASAWDPVRDQLLVHGGYSGSSAVPLGDLWTLTLAGGAPTWSRIEPVGPVPPGRMIANFLYDPARDRFLLLFGYDGSQALVDVWELRLQPAPAWRPLAPSGVPPSARASVMAAYDPARDRVIAFGGGEYLDDLWALDLGAGGDGEWVSLPTPSGPSGRQRGLMRLDALRNRMLLFGGYGLNEAGTSVGPLNDTWALDLLTASWRQIEPSGISPPERSSANGAYDPDHDRLVLTCGGPNDTWALQILDIPTSTQLSLASLEVTADWVRLVWSGARPGTRATAYRRSLGAPWELLGELFADGRGFVSLEDREVMPGATLEYRIGVAGGPGDTYYYGATPVRIPLHALSLSARATAGHLSFAVGLASGQPASLAVFDVAGRRVWSRSVGELGAGLHEVSADDTALPPALYVARLTQGPLARDVKVVVTR